MMTMVRVSMMTTPVTDKDSLSGPCIQVWAGSKTNNK